MATAAGLKATSRSLIQSRFLKSGDHGTWSQSIPLYSSSINWEISVVGGDDNNQIVSIHEMMSYLYNVRCNVWFYCVMLYYILLLITS